MNDKVVRTLLKKKNVVSVGIGIKVANGVPTGKQAVIVGVKKKVPLSELSTRDIIPTSIEGSPSDVQEVGEIKALDGITTRVRPCPGGVSCGSYRITAGTLGFWANKGSQPMLISNNHVLADVNNGKPGDVILQPGKYDGGQNPADQIAQLDTFIPLKFINRNIWQLILDWIFRRIPPTNTVDCAMAAPMEGPGFGGGDRYANTVSNFIDKTITGIGTPAGYIEPMPGMTVKKSGRTTGVTTGDISQVEVTARVNMGDGKMAIFTDQFMVQTKGFSAPGDSGSVILDKNNALVGLLFAGSDDPPVTLGNRWINVKNALGLGPS